MCTHLAQAKLHTLLHQFPAVVLLGSASGVLLKQTSESLAGWVAQLELTPLLPREVLLPNATATEKTYRHSARV